MAAAVDDDASRRRPVLFRFGVIALAVAAAGTTLRALGREFTRRRYGDLDGAVSFTSRTIAAYRAVENERPVHARLFDDPLAAAFAGPIALARIKAKGPLSARLAIRTRFLDDALRAAAVAGCRQVVILGAGMDSRAWRLRAPGFDCVYEVDRADVLTAKEKALAAAAQPPLVLANRRMAVAADLADATWPTALTSAGFSLASPTAWLLEGLTMYLKPEDVAALCRTTASLSAPGSRLLVTLVGERTAANARASAASQTARAAWFWGSDVPETFFAAHGWPTMEVLQIGQAGAHFGRWEGPPPPARSETGKPRTFYVVAEVART